MSGHKAAFARTIGANILLLALGAATGIVAARMLGAEYRGVLAAIIFWPQLVTGIGLYAYYDSVVLSSSDDRYRKGDLVGTGIIGGLLLSVGLLAVSYFAIYLSGEAEHVANLSLLFAAFLAPLTAISLAGQGVQHGEKDFVYLNYFRILHPLLYLIVLLVVWYKLEVSVEYVLYGNIAALFVATLIRTSHSIRKISPRLSLNVLKALYSKAAAFVSSVLLVQFNNSADRWIILSFGDYKSLGYYVVALTISEAGMTALANAIQMVVFPDITNEKNVEIKKEIFSSAIRKSMLVLIAAGLLGSSVMPLLVPILFGESYMQSVFPSAALVMAYALIGLRSLTVSLTRSFGLGFPGFSIEGLNLLLILPSGYVAYQMYGVDGMALSVLFVSVVSFYISLGIIIRAVGFSLSDVWGLNYRTLLELKAMVARL